MSQYKAYKGHLIAKLWVPKAQEYGNVLRPRLRKNKRLKILSLTSHDSFPEVSEFIQARLAVRADVFVWNYDYFKKMRLQSEGFNVLGVVAARYEDTLTKSSNAVADYFTFGILNLDFASQDPVTAEGSIESEVESIEVTFRLQKERQTDSLQGFVLIYTTLIDDSNLNITGLISRLNSYRVNGWAGLNSSLYPNDVPTAVGKVDVIRKLLEEIARKYNYSVLGYDCITSNDIHSLVLGVRSHA